MMKYIFLLLIIGLYSELQSQVSIKSFGNQYATPCDGFIEVEARNGLQPYTIDIKGLSTGYQASVSNINGYHIFSNLCADKYMIYVQGVSSCPTELEQMILGCQSIVVEGDVHGYCTNTPGFINLTVSNGQAPYQYTWLNSRNIVISTAKDVSNLEQGDYTVLIKDAQGCMVTKNYKIERIFMKIQEEYITNLCWNSFKYQIVLTPSGRKYSYKWSDGQEGQKSTIYTRFFDPDNIRPSYTVTITDVLSKCTLTKTINLGITNGNFEVKNIKHASKSYTTDAEVELLWQPYIQWLTPGTFEIYKNGSKLTSPIPWTNPYQDYRTKKFTQLSAGEYTFVLFDRIGCKVEQIDVTIYSCDDSPFKPTIHIYNYSLPPSAPGSYAKATATYPGGNLSQCKYFWYINNNKNFSIGTNIPEINNKEMQRLNISGGGGNRLYVNIFCPCGEATDWVYYDPCHPDKKLVYYKKEIEKLCFGELRTGTPINKKLEAKIDLEIDLGRYFNGSNAQNRLGKKYDNLVSEIRWTDGAQPNETYYSPTKKLSISRTVTVAGIYELVIVDGMGCTFSEKYQVVNEFESQEIVELCIFRVECGKVTGESEQVNDGIVLLDQNSNYDCDLQLWCANSKIKDLQFAGKEDLGYIYENGKCFHVKTCRFNWWPNLINLDKNPKVRYLGENHYEYITKDEVPCCFAGMSREETEFQLGHINSDWIPTNNISIDFVKVEQGLENPCIGVFKCPLDQTYYRIIGTKIATKPDCRKDIPDLIQCKRCYECEFTFNNFTFRSPPSRQPLDICFDLPEDLCTTSVPLCTPESPSPILLGYNKDINVSELTITPNPFEDYISVILHNYHGKKNDKIEICLINAQGINVLKTYKQVNEAESLIIIDTKVLSSGIYFLQLISHSGKKISYKVAKI